LQGTDIFELNHLSSRVAAALTGGARVEGAGLTRLHGSNLTGGMGDARATAIVTAAFEVAYLDAQGQALGLPVHALLGGKLRDRVDFSAYLFYKWAAHPGDDGPADPWGEALGPEAIVAQARRMVDEFGFRSLKLKGGVLEPDAEISTVRALREAFPSHALRIDPNTGWSVETSLRVAQQLSGCLEYLEDPTPGIPGMAEVARKAAMPLATNMCVTGFEHLPQAIEHGAVQIVLSDHHFWGGLRATQRLSGICETWGLSLSMHSNSHLGISLAAMTHLGSVLPTIAYACDTHRPWQSEDVVLADPLPFVDGAIRVPDGPGLGVDLDREALGLLHERWVASDVRVRDDEAAMRVVDPTWAPNLPRF
jgi:glucarate dehydratase